MRIDLLDSGKDPGRYTMVRGDGLVVVASVNGKIERQRTVPDPAATVEALSRTMGIRIVPPGKQKDILKKINFYLERQ